MLVWGLVSASNAFMRDAHGFYALRFLLGVAEGGFTPSMIYYLTLWFPLAYRGRFTAIFCTAIPMAGIISGPLSSLLLGMEGIGGLHGWQWLFLVQGLPAVLLAFAVLAFLPDGPAQAKWLNAERTRRHRRAPGRRRAAAAGVAAGAVRSAPAAAGSFHPGFGLRPVRHQSVAAADDPRHGLFHPRHRLCRGDSLYRQHGGDGGVGAAQRRARTSASGTRR